MSKYAYACQITKENFGAIASENPKFNMQELLDWLEVHESGFFLRDEDSVFDCQYFIDETFFELYRIEPGEPDSMFRIVTRVK